MSTQKRPAQQVYEAAKHRQLDHVPREFLTEETITFRLESERFSTLEWIAAHGDWTQLPPELLTFRVFTHRNVEGRTPMHVAAGVGDLRTVPRQFMTFENLSIRDNGGRTPLHFAAVHGNLDKVPPELMTLEGLMVADNGGATCFHCAAAMGNLAQIPHKWLTRETLTIECCTGTPLEWLRNNSSFDKLPSTALRQCLDVEIDGVSVLELLSVKDFARVKWEMACENPVWLKRQFKPAQLEVHYENGQTLLHWAALACRLSQVPCDLLTGRLLGQEDNERKTVFHHAALGGSLSQIPTELLTLRRLAKRDCHGRTAFHYAARSQSLRQIPGYLLNRRNLSLKDEAGDTPLHWTFGHLSQVPDGVFTRRNLTSKSSLGQSPLQMAFRIFGCGEGNRCHLIPDSFREIPASALWVCRMLILEGKTVIEHLSKEQLATVKAYGQHH